MCKNFEYLLTEMQYDHIYDNTQTTLPSISWKIFLCGHSIMCISLGVHYRDGDCCQICQMMEIDVKSVPGKNSFTLHNFLPEKKNSYVTNALHTTLVHNGE